MSVLQFWRDKLHKTSGPAEFGRVEAIWLKRMKRGPMDPVLSAEMRAGRGMVGSADQGGKRQVTIIEQDVWHELMRGLDGVLSPATRRANIMVSGIQLADSRGRYLRIGECRIRIWGETKPCERMDEALQGLRKAMYPKWLGGAYGEIANNCRISIGDAVCWEDEMTAEPVQPES